MMSHWKPPAMKMLLAVGALLAIGLFVGHAAATSISLAPHHTPGDGFHEDHYFAQTGDGHHFAWLDEIPATSVIDIYYDFRSIGAFANTITATQQTLAVSALNLWASAGNLNFIQNTVVAASQIINIGTGNLAALGFPSGPGGILGLGGGIYTHSATHTITDGVAWMDFAESWDVTIGNGNPAGTFDWFTVAVQEIGHALGLGHTDNDGSSTDDMMDGFYSIEKTVLSADDIAHIQSVYGAPAAPVPEPATALLMVCGLLGLVLCKWWGLG